MTFALAVVALAQFLNHYYHPHEILDGTAPMDRQIRGGGMVVVGSLVYEEEGLLTTFELSDLKGSTFRVRYNGLLPSLFREGQGAIVIGRLNKNKTFIANEVQAKHDENYVPPELKELHKANDP